MKKNKLGILLFVIILGLAMILTACQPAAQPPAPPAEPPAEETIIVGFVYVGSTSDAGWSFAHDQGRIYMEEQLPWVETLTAERVPPGADFDRVVREMIQQGATVIFGTSFGYMDFMVALAEEFPEVIFMHCSGFKTAENMGTYFGRIE
ncbi:MAG TPA: BMP family ABC transporter substrate-binding protein, partial [Candidatus Limnocylindrales bacterium]|nr:BMP family ABC transporter substrate-binding protein [Candidatus Limnocylindrales bacterium]